VIVAMSGGLIEGTIVRSLDVTDAAMIAVPAAALGR